MSHSQWWKEYFSMYLCVCVLMKGMCLVELDSLFS